MTVILRDAMTFLSKDGDPIVGAISYDKPLNTNTTLTIKTGNKVVTLLAKQVLLAIFKLDNKEFGFIFKGTAYHSGIDKKIFNKWNQYTKMILCRELKPCFKQIERGKEHETIPENAEKN